MHVFRKRSGLSLCGYLNNLRFAALVEVIDPTSIDAWTVTLIREHLQRTAQTMYC